MILPERQFLLKALKHTLQLGLIAAAVSSCAPEYESQRNRSATQNNHIETKTLDQDEPVGTMDIEEVVITTPRKSPKITAPLKKADKPSSSEPEKAAPTPRASAKKTKDSTIQVSADVNSAEKKDGSEKAEIQTQSESVTQTTIKENTAPLVTQPSDSSLKVEKTEAVSAKRRKELSFIRTAYDVIQKESKKLGTACNRFIMRVLQLTGFSTEGFIANDFDIYAKKNLKNYRAVKFSDTKELERHLKSFPERTPFIFQWERNAKHGHIALVELSNSKFYTYESSLNSFHPRVKETTISKLLNLSSRKQVIVYSDFIQ